jgi:hypothetical protein
MFGPRPGWLVGPSARSSVTTGRGSTPLVSHNIGENGMTTQHDRIDILQAA